MPRKTYAERRRQMLARKVAVLDALGLHSMITEGLFSLGLGIGLTARAAAHIGPRHAGLGTAKADHRAAHQGGGRS